MARLGRFQTQPTIIVRDGPPLADVTASTTAAITATATSVDPAPKPTQQSDPHGAFWAQLRGLRQTIVVGGKPGALSADVSATTTASVTATAVRNDSANVSTSTTASITATASGVDPAPMARVVADPNTVAYLARLAYPPTVLVHGGQPPATAGDVSATTTAQITATAVRNDTANVSTSTTAQITATVTSVDPAPRPAVLSDPNAAFYLSQLHYRQTTLVATGPGLVTADVSATTTASVSTSATRNDTASVSASTTASITATATSVDPAPLARVESDATGPYLARLATYDTTTLVRPFVVQTASSGDVSAVTVAQVTATATGVDPATGRPPVVVSDPGGYRSELKYRQTTIVTGGPGATSGAVTTTTTATVTATATRSDAGDVTGTTTVTVTATATRSDTASASPTTTASITATATVSSPAQAALTTMALVTATATLAGGVVYPLHPGTATLLAGTHPSGYVELVGTHPDGYVLL